MPLHNLFSKKKYKDSDHIHIHVNMPTCRLLVELIKIRNLLFKIMCKNIKTFYNFVILKLDIVFTLSKSSL